MSTLKVATINIEHGKHLPLLAKFLTEHQPEVLCLQEVPEYILSEIKQVFPGSLYFVPLTIYENIERGEGRKSWKEGIVLGSRAGYSTAPKHFYYQGSEELKVYSSERRNETHAHAVAFTTFLKDGVRYTVGTTHHTWTPDGNTTELQLTSTRKLLEGLNQNKLSDLILCGDFNAPRTLHNGTQGEVYSMLTTRFEGNIPKHITSTLDQQLHRAAPINLVVDNIFTSSHYVAENVQVISGISDHCAILAEIRRRI